MQWHHVVAMRNGATDEQSLYVDGNIEAVTFTQTGNMISGLATPDVLSIGYVDGGFRFTGLIDEVAIYDRVLPGSEIASHFNTGSGPSGKSVVTLRPAPTANAGDDQPDVPELSEVTLIGSGSTYAGETITDYYWTQTGVRTGTGLRFPIPLPLRPLSTHRMSMQHNAYLSAHRDGQRRAVVES